MKRSAEDDAQNSGMDNTWWLESSREASGRATGRDSRDAQTSSVRGSRNSGSASATGSSGAFGALELDSMRLLADLVASSSTPSETGGSSVDKAPYALHRESHRRSADYRPQHFHPSAANAGNFFLPDSARRTGAAGSGGSGGSSCSDGSRSRSSGVSGSRGSSGGVSLSSMSPPHHAAHVHREWRGILGEGEGGAGVADRRSSVRSPSNEESGPTDGSSTHGNGTSLGGSGADSGGSSHRSSARGGGDSHLSGSIPTPT